MKKGALLETFQEILSGDIEIAKKIASYELHPSKHILNSINKMLTEQNKLRKGYQKKLTLLHAESEI